MDRVSLGGDPGREPGGEVQAVAVHSPCQYVGARAGLRPADAAVCGRLDRVRASASGHLSGCRATAAAASGCRAGARPPARGRSGPDARDRQRLCPQRPARGRPGRGRARDRPERAEPAARPALVRGPGRARVPLVYGPSLHKGRRHAASLMWRIAREPRFRWFGRWNQPGRPAGARVPALRRGGAAGRGAADGRHAPPGQGLRRRLHRRRPRRGRPHPRLVPRVRAGGRERPRDHRLRAGLARHDRLPGAQPPRRSASGCSPTAWTCSRGSRTRRSTSRRAPPTGSRPRAPPSSCAGSASARCAASC